MSQTSDWKQKANRENAKKSTGPKSAEGKEIASRNAYKHGFTAMKMTPGENFAETEEALRLWVSDLNPQNVQAHALAQASFEAKLRLDQITRAHHSITALRVRDVEKEGYDKIWNDQVFTTNRFKANPAAEYAVFRRSAPGIAHFLWILGRLETQLETNQWDEEANRTLMKIDGQIDGPTEPILAMHLKCFDTRKKLYAAFESARRTGGPTCDIAQAAEFSIEMQRDEFNAARDYIKTRINDRVTTLRREQIDANQALLDDLALKVDAAKFDPSKDGMLLERYIRERLRDFVKTTHEAIAACTPPKPKRGDVIESVPVNEAPPETKPTSQESASPPPEPPSPPESSPVSATLRISRNEPNNACSDDAGSEVVLPFTAALPVDVDPFDER